MPDSRTDSPTPTPASDKTPASASDRQTPNLVIESLGVYLPPEIASTRDVVGGCEKISPFRRRASVSRVEQFTAIKNRRVASETESASEMAAKAIQKCLAVSRHEPSEIDLLLYCSISRYQAPEHYVSEPAISVELSTRFPFDRALAVDIGNGCAGMFTAITIADSLIKAGLIRLAMVVSGEHITDLMKTAQQEVIGYTDSRFACLTLGDGAAALILEQGSDNTTGFQTLELYTVAQYSGYCIGKPTDQSHGGIIMFTESAKLVEVAENYSIPDMVRVLRARGWQDKEALDHLISHQTAQRAIDKLYEVNRLGGREIVHDGNVVNNLAERGNTASTTHFVALWDRIHDETIRAGDRLLFAVQGSGMTIGTAAYVLDDLPDRVRGVASEEAADVATAATTPLGPARAILRCDTPRTRIESIGIADGGGPASSIVLAGQAMADCLAKSAYGRDDIELLIYAGVHREEFIGEPAIATLLADRLGMNPTAGFPTPGNKTLAFDVYHGPLGFLNACYLAVGMIRAGRIQSAMVVASETEPNVGRPELDPLGVTAAGTAVILERQADGHTGFGHCVIDSFTEHIGAYTSWLATNDGTPRMHVAKHPELEAIYLKCIPETVAELLKCERLRMEDVKVILPPQIPKSLLLAMADALQVELDRVVDLEADGDSLLSSCLVRSFLNLSTADVASGDIGVIINVGSGLQVGAATYYF